MLSHDSKDSTLKLGKAEDDSEKRFKDPRSLHFDGILDTEVACDGHQQPGAPYMLPCDLEERERLRFQHDILRRTFGDKWPILVPDASFSLQPGDQVLDSGTGGGDWLLDAVEHHRSPLLEKENPIIFKGVDISTRCFPPIVPTAGFDISFEDHSVTELPMSWSNTFTLVHQRYLIVALREADWGRAISEICRVLKPSGWLTIIEPGRIEGGPETEKLMNAIDVLLKSNGMTLDCCQLITEMIQSLASDQDGSEGHTGFQRDSVTIRALRTPIGGSNRSDPRERDLAMDAMQNYLAMFRKMKVSRDLESNLGIELGWQKLLDNVEKEWFKSDTTFLQLYVICVQKM